MKWGILATGTIAEKFADTVNHMEQEDETLIACASRNLEHGKAFASKYGIPKVYGSYAQMMTDSEVDAVYIATPNSLHYENCRMCLEAGKQAAVKTAAARTALLRAALGSVADKAIIPMYDWLGLGAEAHLNTPGKLGGNWAWRAKAGFDTKTLAAQIKAECAVYCRCNADVQNVKELAI